MRLVLDASAAVPLVMRGEAADKLIEPVSAATVVAEPSLYASEVANALGKYVKAGSPEAEAALEHSESAASVTPLPDPLIPLRREIHRDLGTGHASAHPLVLRPPFALGRELQETF
jgi:predicted nucleic acid-binding protein